MRQLVLVVDSQCFVASIYALDVRMSSDGLFLASTRAASSATIMGGHDREPTIVVRKRR